LPISDLIGQPIPTDFQCIAVQYANLHAVLLEKAGKSGHAYRRRVVAYPTSKAPVDSRGIN
jgi:hypothetical protein